MTDRLPPLEPMVQLPLGMDCRPPQQRLFRVLRDLDRGNRMPRAPQQPSSILASAWRCAQNYSLGRCHQSTGKPDIGSIDVYEVKT